MKKILFYFLCIFCFASCKTPQDISYFQDVTVDDYVLSDLKAKPLVIQPGDVLRIVVHSRDPQIASLFNLSIQGYRVGQTESSGSPQATTPYTVASDGTIDFPILGKLEVKGKTRDELSQMIKNRLIGENHCNDAIVTIELSNAYITVLGEVARPGRYSITKDCINIFDALGMANDLTIQGRRDNVIVIRQEKDITHAYRLNLMSVKQLSSSPAYYLQQDDIVYVEPNDYRKRQTTVNGNTSLSTSFWISVTSLLVTILNFTIKL